MAGLKRTIREQCESCSGRNARKVGDTIVVSHNCPNAPPGPCDPPRSYHVSQVIFEPGEFTAETLREELDKAWVLIDDLRKKRWAAEDAALRNVRLAFKGVYDHG